LEKVLVTGGSGYIGSNLLPALEGEGYEIHSLQRSAREVSGTNIHIADVTDYVKTADIVHKVKPDSVIHLAASGFNYAKKETLDDLIRVNFTATMKLAEACMALPEPPKFVYPTTYMECQGSEKPISADCQLVPQSEYALSKSLSTNYLLYATRAGLLDATILRLFSVYGKNDLKFRFIPSIFDAMMRGKSIETTSLSQKRDFVYIDDVVSAMLCAIRAKGSKATLYNVGSGKATRLLDVAETIRGLFPDSKGKMMIGAKPDRPNEAPCYYADIYETERALSWKAKYGLKQGLLETKKALGTQ